MQLSWRGRLFRVACIAFGLLGANCFPQGKKTGDALNVDWPLDNLARLGGYPMEAVGEPRAQRDAERHVICFDGADDALIAKINPLDGQTSFTVEVLFQPARGGGGKQQFLHIEDAAQNRVMVELRLLSDARWYLHTFAKSAGSSLELSTADLLHPSERWHWAALTFSEGKMVSYVDGQEQVAGRMNLIPLGAGDMSIGARRNQESWFKGCIKELRFANVALDGAAMQRAAD